MTSVVMVGLMGAGKSSVGARVAAATGRVFVDVDRDIQRRTGKTVRQLWEEGGEPAYRHLESEVVLETLAQDDNVVLAAPGGAILDPAVRAALGPPFVVWLRADPSTLAARVEHDDHRPLLGDHPLVVLTSMARERAGLYGSVADLVVDTEGRDTAAIADIVVEEMGVRRLSV
jgi:shikimate kinase